MFHRLLLASILAVSLTIVGCADVGDAAEAKVGEKAEVAESTGDILSLDGATSSVAWRAAKVTKTHDGGFNTISGSVTVDGVELKSVVVNIDPASIWADAEKLTGHLKSPDFFDVEKFKEAGFEMSSVVELDTPGEKGETHSMIGNLTMHGVTKSVSFPMVFEIVEGIARAKADFIINRKDWGLMYPGAPDDLIRDDVRIIFDVSAKL